MIVQLQEELVQGPIDHPRLKKTVVVCPTVETSRANRFPSQAVVVTTAARRLMSLSKEGEKVHAVLVVSGSKDPTAHPEFHEISEMLRELVNKWFPKADLCLVSNEPELDRAQSRHALHFYDQPIVRLEAGTQKTFTALTGSPGKTFKALVENLGKLEMERLILQACFVRGSVDNSKESDVKAWLRVLSGIKPASIHISTPEKASKDGRKPITKTRMGQIEAVVAESTGVPVEICAT